MMNEASGEARPISFYVCTLLLHSFRAFVKYTEGSMKWGLNTSSA